MSPRRRARASGLLLTPGASATKDHASLVVIDEALAAVGIPVSRIDLPSTSAKAPVHVAAIRAAAEELAAEHAVPVKKLAFGGRSFGGRMCSVAAADGVPVAALVLISYPLHPPGKPDQLRTAHFADITVPCLFVSGTRDAFGTPAELEAATAAIPGEVTHVWIDGGDHGLRKKDQAVAEAVTAWLAG